MSVTNGKTKTRRAPRDLMDLHLALIQQGPALFPHDAMMEFADAVIRACAAPAAEMRVRVFDAVEALRDSQGD